MAPVTTRQRYLEAVVELMVDEGRVDQTLEALAAAAGTSDRMLVYYFETRDALAAEAVRLLRERRRQLANTVMTRISLAPLYLRCPSWRQKRHVGRWQVAPQKAVQLFNTI